MFKLKWEELTESKIDISLSQWKEQTNKEAIYIANIWTGITIFYLFTVVTVAYFWCIKFSLLWCQHSLWMNCFKIDAENCIDSFDA